MSYQGKVRRGNIQSGKRPVGEKSTGESSAMERKMSGNVNEQKEVRDHFCEGQGALL